MLVGLVGKPNVGKSTFFSAATKAPAEIANYPFTTIHPNRGVAYIRHACPHPDFHLARCTPRTGMCAEGTRFVPVDVLDVAGLVRGAHEGKGLGNQFLDDLRQASALVHVVDASGSTDEGGSPVAKGAREPADDVAMLADEIDHWIAGIVRKGFEREAKAIEMKNETVHASLVKRLAGLGLTEHEIIHAVDRSVVDPIHPSRWTEADTLDLARHIRTVSKPFLLAANKIDLAPPDALKKLEALGMPVVATSASSELALRKAADAGVIRYTPGAGDFSVVDDSKLNAAQRKGLDYIRDHVLKPYGSTGVQRALEETVYRLLNRIVAFPVEDETHLTDKEGRVLPDAHLVVKGTTAKQLAFRVHTDLGEHFIRAVDARTKRVIGADHELKTGDVVRIVAAR